MDVLLKTAAKNEIIADIENIANDERLYQEKYFNARSQAIDDIEFHVIDRIDALAEGKGATDQLNSLRQHALKVRGQLEEVNSGMFHQLRTRILRDGCRERNLMELINEYFDLSTHSIQDTIGYDNLDIFLNGLLSNQKPPSESRKREPGMIYYQKTPARIILKLIERAAFKPQDVFFDLGSGLGQVPMLVNLLSSVKSIGIEIEPAFCNYAKSCAADLHLTDIEFINKDARFADYSSGTVFFMYTPFEGMILQETLENLKGEAKKRRIRIFTFGPCTPANANEEWLVNIYNTKTSSGEFAEFQSVSL